MIAVGTTTTRTLEAVARAHGERIVEGASATDLFIFPGFRASGSIEELLTNFHLPRSSLLMLVFSVCRPRSRPGGVSRSHRQRYRLLILRRRDADSPS